MEAASKARQAVDPDNEKQSLWAIVVDTDDRRSRRAVRAPNFAELLALLPLFVLAVGGVIVLLWSLQWSAAEDACRGWSNEAVKSEIVIRVAIAWRFDFIIAQYCILSG